MGEDWLTSNLTTYHSQPRHFLVKDFLVHASTHGESGTKAGRARTGRDLDSGEVGAWSGFGPCRPQTHLIRSFLRVGSPLQAFPTLSEPGSGSRGRPNHIDRAAPVDLLRESVQEG